MKKCMLLQVYDRHWRSWSRYSGFVCHLPTSFANHRWSFADSGLLGSMASPFTVLFLFPLQTSPVLFPLLRLLVEACPVLRHSGAVQAFSLPYVFEVSSGRVMKISIIWLYSFDFNNTQTFSSRKKRYIKQALKIWRGRGVVFFQSYISENVWANVYSCESK